MDTNERAFWIAVRAGLLMVIAAIERYCKVGKFAPGNVEVIPESDTVTPVQEWRG